MITLFWLAAFVLAWIKWTPKEKERPPAPVTVGDVKRAEKARKEAAKKEQAAEDKAFFERKLPILHEMLDAANDSLKHANSGLEYADLANRESGAAVVSGKQIDAYRKERENALKQIMKLESQIHTAEARIEKAKYIIKYGG